MWFRSVVWFASEIRSPTTCQFNQPRFRSHISSGSLITRNAQQNTNSDQQIPLSIPNILSIRSVTPCFVEAYQTFCGLFYQWLAKEFFVDIGSSDFVLRILKTPRPTPQPLRLKPPTPSTIPLDAFLIIFEQRNNEIWHTWLGWLQSSSTHHSHTSHSHSIQLNIIEWKRYKLYCFMESGLPSL